MPDRFEQPEAVWLVQEPTGAGVNAPPPTGDGLAHPLLPALLLIGLTLLWRRRRPQTLEDRAARRLARMSGLPREQRAVVRTMARRIGAHPVALLVSEEAFRRAQRRTPPEEQPLAAEARRRLPFGA